MKAKNKKPSSTTSHKRLASEAEGAASGALVGAAIGAAAGPPGMVVGAIVGGLAGSAAGAALDNESSRQEERTRELDEQIGVGGGDLGAPNLAHPPAKIGAYSTASTGAAAASDPSSAEGPMQIPEE